MTTPTGSAAGTVIDQSTPAVLRRRHKDLRNNEGYNEEYCRVFTRAAEELDALAAERDALKARVAELEAGTAAQVWFHLKMENHALKAQLTAAQQAAQAAIESEARMRVEFRARELCLEGALSKNLDLLVACRSKISHDFECSAARGSESDCTCLRGVLRTAIDDSHAALSTHPSAREQGEAHE